jgi:hypothetical protein
MTATTANDTVLGEKMMTEDECDNQLENIADSLARVLNSRARVKCRPDRLIVFQPSTRPQTTPTALVSTIMGRHSLINYQSAKRQFEYTQTHFHMAKLIQHWTRATIARTANLTTGAVVDVSEWFGKDPEIYTAMYHGFNINKDYYDEFNRGTLQSLQSNVHLTAGRMMDKMASVIRPDVFLWIEQLLRTIYKSYDEFTLQKRWSEDTFLDSWISRLVDVIVSHSIDSDAYTNSSRHAYQTQVRLKSLLMDLNVARSREFHSKLSELNDKLNLIQATVSMREECVEDSLNDPALETVIKNPPPQLLHQLRSLAAEHCLMTLEAAFDQERPIEVRKNIYYTWKQAHERQIVQSCCTVREVVNRTRQSSLMPPEFRTRLSTSSAVDAGFDIELPPPLHTKAQCSYFIKKVFVACEDRYFGALFMLIRVLLSMTDKKTIRPLVLNASMLNSVAQIAFNDQNYIIGVLQSELERMIMNFNMDCVMTTEELNDLTCGEFMEELAEASKMLQFVSSTQLHQLQQIFFHPNGVVRDTREHPLLTLMYKDLSLRLHPRLIQPPARVSLNYVARSLAMIMPAVVHYRQHQQLLCTSLRTGMFRQFELESQWDDNHRMCFERLYAIPHIRSRMEHAALVASSSTASSSSALTISFLEFKQLPLTTQAWFTEFAKRNPTTMKMNKTPKRSRDTYEQNPQVEVKYAKLCM